MNKLKRILLHGAYNGSNYGDFILAWLIQKRIFNANAVPVLNNASPYFLRIMGHDDTLPLKADWNSVDAAIFGGGGYLATKSIGIRAIRLLLLTHLRPMRAIAANKKPFVVCGTGVGPIHDPILQKITVNTLNKANFIHVRNIESKQYLEKYGIKKEIFVTSDLALAFTKSDIPTKCLNDVTKVLKHYSNKRKVFIHINLLNLHKKNKSKIECGCDLLVNELKQLSENHNDLLFIIGTDYESDKVDEINQYIYKMLGKDKCLLLKEYDVWKLSAYLALVDVVITTKLHVGIIATSLEKTVISFSGDQKIRRFYSQIGAPERCLELKDLKQGDCLKQIEQYLYSSSVNIIEQRKQAEYTLSQIEDFVKNV